MEISHYEVGGACEASREGLSGIRHKNETKPFATKMRQSETGRSAISRLATKFETRQLLALSRLGSTRKVAEAFALTTSTVSQQIAAFAKEAGEQLIEPDGRRVRLTPSGRRLADHAVTILAAVDAARLDLDPDAEPAGTVRVGGFATGIRVSLLPIVRELTVSHPHDKVAISEYDLSRLPICWSTMISIWQ